jgi:hypothetical protein
MAAIFAGTPAARHDAPADTPHLFVLYSNTSFRRRAMTPEIFIPFVLTLAPVLIVLIAMVYRYRQTQARYHLLLQLADKNVDLPATLLSERLTPFSERRRALVLISGGLGLTATFLALPFKLDGGLSIGSLWGLGLLPVMTGLGYLASWWLNWRGEKA